MSEHVICCPYPRMVVIAKSLLTVLSGVTISGKQCNPLRNLLSSAIFKETTDITQVDRALNSHTSVLKSVCYPVIDIES